MARADDPAADTVAVILAGGNGTRLDPLTRSICKPALPFGAGFRSIDFSLSNCAHSGIDFVGVPTQYRPEALLAHLADAWSGGRPENGPAVLPWPGEERAPQRGYRGTADAVYRNLTLIDQLGRDLVLILAGDHVYQMDYRPMLERHRELGAALTVGCIDVPVREAVHFGVLALGAHERIERFVEKPRTAAELPVAHRGTVPASMGIYVFDREFLARVLDTDASTTESRHDFGADILPRLIRNARAFAYPFRNAPDGGPSYWRDIGTLGAYWRAHLELLGRSPAMRLDEKHWRVLGAADMPRKIGARSMTANGGTIEDSLVGAGCTVAGHVRRSVIFQGVEVGPNATVEGAVILPGAVIGAGCRLSGIIVGSGCNVAAGTIIERLPKDPSSVATFEPTVLTAEGADATDGKYALAT